MNTPTVDQLVNDVYSQMRHDLVKVTVCATTVRVHRHDQPDVWLQKNATEPGSLCKVHISGQYLLGMETLHDGFRFAEYCQSASNASQKPGIADNDQASEEYVKKGGNTCLICKSEHIEGGLVQTDSGIAWQKVVCSTCGSEWTDNYRLENVSGLHTDVPLRIGQRVYWTDPDNNSSSGEYSVQRILAQDVALIVNLEGSEAEVPMSELKLITVDPPVDDKCCEALNCGLILTEPFAVVREYINKDGGPSVFAEGHYNPHGEFIVDAFDGFGDGRFDLAENSDKCANCDNAL